MIQEQLETCGQEECECSHTWPCDRGWLHIDANGEEQDKGPVRHCPTCHEDRVQQEGESRTAWLARLQGWGTGWSGETPPPPPMNILNRVPPTTEHVAMYADSIAAHPCPFCQAPAGSPCTIRGTGRIMIRHRRYHPARYEAAGVDEPQLSMDEIRWIDDEPLTMPGAAEAEEVVRIPWAVNDEQ